MIKLYTWLALSASFALLSIIWAALAIAMISSGDCGVSGIARTGGYWQLLPIFGIPALAVFVAVKVFRYRLRQLPLVSLK
jgi:hypothetical protein